MAGSLPCGKAAVVLDTETNEEINLSIRQIDDVLNGLFGRIEVLQKGQFDRELGVDRPFDRSQKRILGKTLPDGNYSYNSVNDKKNSFIFCQFDLTGGSGTTLHEDVVIRGDPVRTRLIPR